MRLKYPNIQSHRAIEFVRLLFCDGGLSTVHHREAFSFVFVRVGTGVHGVGSVLDPTDGLHLVGVSLGAVLVVVSVLALASVSLQDVLVATVTRELVGHPADKGRVWSL